MNAATTSTSDKFNPVTDMVVKSMFDFLSATDSGDNVRAKLVQRYPDHKDFIMTLKRDDEDLFKKKESKSDEPSVVVEDKVATASTAVEVVETETVEVADEVVVEAAQAEEVVEPVPTKPAKAPKAKADKPAKDTKAPKAKADKPAKADKGTSKMDIARKLYADAADKSRKAIIELFMNDKDLKFSKAAASTYYYLVKK